MDGRYPGTEWVVTEGSEVRGPYPVGRAVETLGEEGVEVKEDNGKFLADRALHQAHRRPRSRCLRRLANASGSCWPCLVKRVDSRIREEV